LNQAIEARKNAYAPYSHFLVGAALLSADGRVFTGCNVENGSYSATMCAERTALFSAVAAGARAFQAIAIAGGEEGMPLRPACPPCGVCRQALSEFFVPDARVILGQEEHLTAIPFSELFPAPFALSDPPEASE
jgi:cytidine deaminase